MIPYDFQVNRFPCGFTPATLPLIFARIQPAWAKEIFVYYQNTPETSKYSLFFETQEGNTRLSHLNRLSGNVVNKQEQKTKASNRERGSFHNR
jgi:hypothetical protein